MAARSSKTSKTAHVMGLLNKTEIPDTIDEPIARPAPPPPVQPAPPQPVVYEQPPQSAPYAPQPYPPQQSYPQQAPYPQQPYPQPIVYAAPPPPPPAPTIVTAPAAPSANVAIETGGDAASVAVRSALAEYFSLQESEAALSSPQQSAPSAPVQPVIPSPLMQAPILSAPPPPPPMPVTPHIPNKSTAFSMKGFDFVNVMQLIVERKAKKYMSLFGVCECSKCFADVCAIALNNLPPKYAVHRSGDVASTVSVCESRFEASAVAQVTKACRIVMENPQHEQ